MRKLILVLALMLGCTLNAQKDSNLISRHRPGVLWYYNGLRPLKDADNRKYDRFVVDLTYNDWAGATNPFKNKWNSLGMNLNFLSDIRFKKSKNFSLGIGASYGFSTIASSQRIIETSHNNLALGPKAQNENFDYASIRAHRFFIPIELRFFSKNWNRVKFMVGGSFGIQTGLKQRLISKIDGKTVKTDSYFNPSKELNYGLHVRLGLRNISFFGAYQLNPFVAKSKNLNLHALQFGLSLSLF